MRPKADCPGIGAMHSSQSVGVVQCAQAGAGAADDDPKLVCEQLAQAPQQTGTACAARRAQGSGLKAAPACSRSSLKRTAPPGSRV